MRGAARTSRRSRFTGVVALGLVALVVPASIASARGTYDLRGKWAVGGTGGAASGDLTITSMSLSTGAFSGTSFGGQFKVKGTERGNQVTITQTGGSYVSTSIGSVSKGGKRMSGVWHDSNGAAGTWFGTKTSAPVHHNPLCLVPKLRGKTLAAAKQALKKARCSVGKVTKHKSSKVSNGRIISSSPKSGSKRKAGTKVALTVSWRTH